MQKQKCKLPLIVFDIDGVLLKGHQKIKQAPSTLKFLQQEIQKINQTKYQNQKAKIPFLLLTNGGGVPEQAKVDALNSILELQNEENQIKVDQAILNYTPLKHIIAEYQNKLVLVDGAGNTTTILDSLGQSQYISVQEYLSIYPFLYRKSNSKPCQTTLQTISERLNIDQEKLLQNPLQISSIFILYDPVNWEQSIQLITDLLTTENGQISSEFPLKNFEKHIPIYCVNNDLVYKGQFQLPRIGNGLYNAALKHTYKQLYGKEMQINMYGKPYKNTYDYAEKIGRMLMERNNCENFEYEISQFYMIGDNPEVDIKGANMKGWDSVLVKTGVYSGNESDCGAGFICENLEDAVYYIMKKEGVI